MRILLATDAKPAADGAVRMAAVLAADLNAEIEVVHILSPLPVYGPGAVGTVSFEAGDDVEARSRTAVLEVSRAISGVVPEAVSWPVRVLVGAAPLAIARLAENRGASLILLGRGRHGRVERWFGTETALRVMQLSHVPVVAVPEGGGERRPQVIVAAVDFSDFSRDSITAARRISAPGAVFHLVHVIAPLPMDVPELSPAEWLEPTRERVHKQLSEWAAALGEMGTGRFEFHALYGDTPHEVSALAEQVGADLVVAGSHGLGFFGRVLLGSVSSALLRQIDRPVLIAPPPEPARELGESTTELGPPR